MVDINEIRRQYVDETWKELVNYWEKYTYLKDDRFYKVYEKDPWFGPFSSWMKDFGNNPFVEMPPFTGKTKFGVPIDHIIRNAESISAELNFLLPGTNKEEEEKISTHNVRSFLPVLIWAYCLNRKAPKGENKESAEESMPALVQFLFYGNNEWYQSDVEKYKRLFLLRNWQKTYSKLSIKDISNRNLERVYRVYRRLLFFFYLLRKTSDKCNVTQSFLVFAYMTGLVELLGPKAVDLINSIMKSDKPTEDDCTRNEILSLVNDVINGYAMACPNKFLPQDVQMSISLDFLIDILREYGYMDIDKSKEINKDNGSGELQNQYWLYDKQWKLLDEVAIFIGKNADAICNNDLNLLSPLQDLVKRVCDTFQIGDIDTPFREFGLNLLETLLDQKIDSAKISCQNHAEAGEFDRESVLSEEEKETWNQHRMTRCIQDIYLIHQSLSEDESLYGDVYKEIFET